MIETGDGPDREIVTAVRFDGVAAPTFRELGVTARPLDGVGTVDVATATLAQFLHASARHACASIAPLQRAIRRTVGRLRAGDVQAASEGLPRLTSSLDLLTTITKALAGAWAGAGSCRPELATQSGRVSAVLQAVALHRQSGDWAALAGVLERDLMPVLDEIPRMHAAAPGVRAPDGRP